MIDVDVHVLMDFTVSFRITYKEVQRVYRTQGKIIRDFRAVKSACPAYTKSYTLPATDKSNV